MSTQTTATGTPILSSSLAMFGLGLFAVTAAVAAGCNFHDGTRARDNDAAFDVPMSLSVSLLGEPYTGCGPEESPLPFDAKEFVSFEVEIKALGANGEDFSYTGPIEIKVLPGIVSDIYRFAQMEQGRVSTRVKFRKSHGRTVIWAETLAEGGYATGVSQPLCFARPKISDIQRSDKSYNTPLEGEDVSIGDGVLLVTGINSKGFYVTDLNEEEYNGLFVFTFSNPIGIFPGTRLCSVSGSIKEFIGFTEVVFPSYSIFGTPLDERDSEDEIPDPREHAAPLTEECDLLEPEIIGAQAIPEPVVLNLADIPPADLPVYESAHMKLDRYEARLVRIENARVPSRFEACDLDGNGVVDRCFEEDCLSNLDPMDSDFCDTVASRPACNRGGANDCSCNAVQEQLCMTRCVNDPECSELTGLLGFGQWTVTLGEGREVRRFTVISDTLPDFDPRQQPGTRIRSLTGHLKQIDSVVPVWAIEPRWPDDLILE